MFSHGLREPPQKGHSTPKGVAPQVQNLEALERVQRWLNSDPSLSFSGSPPSCAPGRLGQLCECSEAELSSPDLESGCRAPNGTGPLCSGKGRCQCGRCSCSGQSSGRLCECDDASCERHEGVLCGGTYTAWETGGTRGLRDTVETDRSGAPCQPCVSTVTALCTVLPQALAAAGVECVTVTPTARAERVSAVRTRIAVWLPKEGSAVATDSADATVASAWMGTTGPCVTSV